ncbi:hypothetical protein FRC02_004561 [Tulasnella sp. 418]|nr:hypothetical protein FRC02_004561 [Tulasnella sp. 418]
MTVFSRLATVLALSSFLLIASPVSANSDSLSHHRHPHASNYRHVHLGRRSSKKRRNPNKEGKCKPKGLISQSKNGTNDDSGRAVGDQNGNGGDESASSQIDKGQGGEKGQDNKDDHKGEEGSKNNGDNKDKGGHDKDGGNSKNQDGKQDNGKGEGNDHGSEGEDSGNNTPLGGSKVGLAWNNKPEDMTQFLGENSAVSWSYSWSPWNPNPKGRKIEFCPMMWGAKQEEDWWKTFEKNKKAKCVLGMNEPDRHDQGAIDPWAAAALWKRTVEKLPPTARRVSPAPAGGEEGFAWLHNFIKACDGCQIDAIGAHIYTTDIEAFKTYLTRVHNEYGRPVWVTEWACMNFAKGQGSCTRDQAFAFNGAAIDWMNSQWWIEKFAAFGSLRDMYNVDQDDRLMTADGKITDLGWDYIRIRN